MPRVRIRNDCFEDVGDVSMFAERQLLYMAATYVRKCSIVS